MLRSVIKVPYRGRRQIILREISSTGSRVSGKGFGFGKFSLLLLGTTATGLGVTAYFFPDETDEILFKYAGIEPGKFKQFPDWKLRNMEAPTILPQVRAAPPHVIEASHVFSSSTSKVEESKTNESITKKEPETKKSTEQKKEQAPTENSQKAEKKKDLPEKPPEPLLEKPKPNRVNPFIGHGNKEAKNELLEERLKANIAKAQEAVHEATSAKLATMIALEKHMEAIRDAILAGAEADWTAVLEAHAYANDETTIDIAAEKRGRQAILGLEKVVCEGSQGETTRQNALLVNARATAVKLTKELDEMGKLMKLVDAEHMLAREYGCLIKKSRRNFPNELSPIITKAKVAPKPEVKNMTTQQLNALLQNAHLRVDRLHREISQMKTGEKERLAAAFAAKRAVFEKSRLDSQKDVMEMTDKSDLKSSSNQKTDVVNQVLVNHQNEAQLEKEFALRLKEIEKKYDEQLQQVVRTQRQLFDIEKSQDIEKATDAVKKVYADSLNKALGKLEGIEAALRSRVVQDAENRRSKQAWLAVQNLVESIEYGKKGACCMEGRRLPLDHQLKVIGKTAMNNEFMELIDKSFDEEAKIKGEYTKEDLKTRFDKVYKIGCRIASLDENGGGPFAYLTSWIRNALVFNIPRKMSSADRFDPRAISNRALLERARYHMNRGEVIEAVKLLQLTRGPLRKLADDFILDARGHEESLFLARLLLAHAALTSIRTTY